MIISLSHHDEVIAHFVGHWHIALEAARLRLDILPFDRLPEQQIEPEPIDASHVRSIQAHAVKYYMPGVAHEPEPWQMSGYARPVHTGAQLPSGDIDIVVDRTAPSQPHHHAPSHSSEFQYAPVPGEGPGQVVFVIRQSNVLMDNDRLDMGGAEMPEHDIDLDLRIEQMLAVALGINPLAAIAGSGQADDLGDYVAKAGEAIDGLEVGEHYVVAHAETIDGIYVNGELVETAPSLDDVLPDIFKDQPTQIAPEVTSEVITSDGVDGSITLQAGGNLLINTALLNNTAFLGGVVAVHGDVHRLDVIIQSNICSDVDVLPDALAAGTPTTTTYNLATFDNQSVDIGGKDDTSGEDAGPLNWRVTVVDGDLVFAQWLVQTNFVYDNDLHVLNQTGSQSNFITGANFAQNIVNFADLGHYYDLIIIGGTLYDANIIVQGNILLDDDVVGAGYGGGGSAGGNLLFNGATISNLGVQQWQEGLPSHYKATLDCAEDDLPSMPNGFTTDADFAGLLGLNVLIIKGDVFDVHYIKQVNVLGDADKVAFAEAAIADGATGDWQISTGSNALINVATIIDADALGASAYVGGELYSDAILIQADILDIDVNGCGDGPQDLVTEAIAFIGADDIGDTACGDGPIELTPSSGASLDVMHSVLA